MNAPKIDLADDNFGCVLNCAVRYAMGRETYMPSLVISFITPLLPYLSDNTLWRFDQDITEDMAIKRLTSRTGCGFMWMFAVNGRAVALNYTEVQTNRGIGHDAHRCLS